MADGAHDMAVMMKVYTEGMQAQFGAMMDKFRTSMEQSVGMSRMMNDMMEHLLLQSLHVECVIMRDVATATTALHLHVRNTGAIPIPVVCCTISISRRCAESSGDSSNNAVVVVKTSPQDLDVGAHTSTVLPLDLPSIDQYNGQIFVSCVSPGSGQRLQKTNDFSVYLLHQWEVRPSFQRMPHLSSAVASAPLDLVRLRQVLQISPADGIVLATQGHYTIHSMSSPEFVLAVSLVNGATCHVHVVAAGDEAAPRSRYTPADVVVELEALARPA